MPTVLKGSLGFTRSDPEKGAGKRETKVVVIGYILIKIIRQCEQWVTQCKLVSVLYVEDIQEFYEITLLDSEKTLQEKTAETLQIALKWEKEPPISQPKSPSSAQPQLPSKPHLPAQTEVINWY